MTALSFKNHQLKVKIRTLNNPTFLIISHLTSVSLGLLVMICNVLFIIQNGSQNTNSAQDILELMTNATALTAHILTYHGTRSLLLTSSTKKTPLTLRLRQTSLVKISLKLRKLAMKQRFVVIFVTKLKYLSQHSMRILLRTLLINYLPA